VDADEVTDLIPFVHVSDLERSLAFYERLGFSVKATHEHNGRLDWAALAAGSAQLMLAGASGPVDRTQQAVLFYLYTDDLPGLRARLVSEGLPVGEIRDGSPGPRQELAMSDPDGYCLMVAQIED
jgi:catechol 2,3-dioxygenase-like lactoylglutathione lyase family enzyme